MRGIADAPKYAKMAKKIVSHLEIVPDVEAAPTLVISFAAILAAGARKGRTGYLIQGFLIGAGTVMLVNRLNRKEVK